MVGTTNLKAISDREEITENFWRKVWQKYLLLPRPYKMAAGFSITIGALLVFTGIILSTVANDSGGLSDFELIVNVLILGGEVLILLTAIGHLLHICCSKPVVTSEKVIPPDLIKEGSAALEQRTIFAQPADSTPPPVSVPSPVSVVVVLKTLGEKAKFSQVGLQQDQTPILVVEETFTDPLSATGSEEIKATEESLLLTKPSPLAHPEKKTTSALNPVELTSGSAHQQRSSSANEGLPADGTAWGLIAFTTGTAAHGGGLVASSARTGEDRGFSPGGHPFALLSPQTNGRGRELKEESKGDSSPLIEKNNEPVLRLHL